MKKFLALSSITIATLLLSSCSLLYPNWDSDLTPSDPEPSPTEIVETPTSVPSESATPSASPTVNKKSASVVITDAGVDASAGVIYAVGEVSNVAENDGICTITFTGAGVTKTATAKAEANVNRTECYPLQISLKGLPKGAAIVTVSYESHSSSGQSKAVGVVVP